METKFNSWAVFLGLFLLASGARAQTTRLNLSLEDLTRDALHNSPRLAAARLSAQSALSEAHAAASAEFPQLRLSGNYFYNTTIPQFSINPLAPPVPFGFHDNWSANASLSFDLWDFRSLHNQANSATALSRSQEQNYESVRRQMLLALRMAYFQAQINLEQVRLLGDSLKVAQAQYADIDRKARFGTASRMDRLSAHQQVIGYERSFSRAQAALASSLRDLFDLTGEKEPADLDAPLDSRMEGVLPRGVPAPTVWLSMDPEKESMERLRKEAAVPPDDTVPQLKTYAYLADSARFAADAVASQMLPKITLSAQSGYQDPVGPIDQTIQQNTLSLTASMPLFDWGQILDDSDAKRKQSQAYLKNLDQAKRDLWRDWDKAQDTLRSLEYQRGLDATAVSETQELAKLTYGAYKAGTTRFLEVQTADFQALDAKVQALSNDIQMLMQLSVLSSLSGKE